MKHARFLLRVVPRDGDREEFLSSLKSIGTNLNVSVKHPRWTSYGGLEVDVFAPSHEDFGVFVGAIEPLSKVEFTRDLGAVAPFKPKEEVMDEAVRYFDAERYWECHETLEPIWRSSKGEERSLVQAIILVCAALVHEQRGEAGVALGIYRRALPKLAWDSQTYHGIDVSKLRKSVERSLESGQVRPFKI